MLPPEPIGVEEVRRRQEAGQDILFVDARIPDSWDQAAQAVAGAIRLPPSQVENHLRCIPQGRPVVTYADAADGYSAIRAAEALIHNGWKDVHPLDGGFQSWQQAGRPTEPKSRLSVNIDS